MMYISTTLLKITKPFHNKAEKLLAILKSDPRFHVAKNSEIYVDTKRISHSYISDALNEAMNSRSKLGAMPGWYELAYFLNQRIPPQLVGKRI